MSKCVGYLEGTDSIWLTALNASGYCTLPYSNGFDGHGMNIGFLSKSNKVDVLLAYYHKLMPPESDMTAASLLHRTTVYDIPVLIACPGEYQGKAKKLFGEIPANVNFVDPEDMLDAAKKILG